MMLRSKVGRIVLVLAYWSFLAHAYGIDLLQVVMVARNRLAVPRT